MRVLLVVALLGCDSATRPAKDTDTPFPDQGRVADVQPPEAGLPDVGSPDAGSVHAVAGPDVYAVVGTELALDGSASLQGAQYLWDFGDGQRWETPRSDPVGRVTYARQGRFQATLTVIDANGRRDADGVTVSVTWPRVHTPLSSGSIVTVADDAVAVVVPDADLLVRVGLDGSTAPIPTCPGPRTVAVWGRGLAVACPGGDAVRVHEGATILNHEFAYGSRPYAVIVDGDRLVVTLQGTGEVVALRREGPTLVEVARWPAIADARGLALLPDGRWAVTRWRSPDQEGRLVLLDGTTGAREEVTLAYDNQDPSDTEIGGVPGYLGQILVSPTGREAAVPSLQANVRHGPWFDGQVPTFDTVLRGIVSYIDLTDNTEDFGARKQFDGRGFAHAGVYSGRGDYLFVAMRGSQVIERVDRLSGNPAGTLLDAGFAVEGLALSTDDRWLFADASLSREVRIWDVSNLRAVPLPVITVSTVTTEPLDPQILLGKKLFNDSADPRLGRDGYIACAHCHLDGDSDRLRWDFTARGEGLRNTISLLGRAGTGHGPLHWSANFDEVQDFEHDLRGPNSGEGLMSDADFAQANTTMGPPKAGRSADLDALAAFVSSLTQVPRSPHHQADGAPTAAAQRGEAVFNALACATCHIPPTYTDSGFAAPGVPLLHDMGTLSPSSGERLGGALVGIDTPTLLGLFDSAPYLHDASAQTLTEVLVDRNRGGQHGDLNGVSAEDFADLEAFLLSLDGP